MMAASGHLSECWPVRNNTSEGRVSTGLKAKIRVC